MRKRRTSKVVNHCIMFASVVGVLAFASGCEGMFVRTVRYEARVREPKQVGFVPELLDRADVQRTFQVIGVIQIEAGAEAVMDKIVERFRDEARKLGADAVVDLTNQPIGAGAPTSQGVMIYSGHVRDIWTAKAIAWTD